MKRIAVCAATLLATSFGCITNPMTEMGPSGTMMPKVVGRNLHYAQVQFPGDLRGQPTLLLIAFLRHQQADIDTWLARLPELEAGIADLRVLELPVLSRGYLWMRSYIDGGMRGGIPDSEARTRTVTIYTNKKAFRKALGLGDESRIYAVLLDEDTRILRTQEGPADDGKIAAIIRSP
jgi:hypothetical protein